MNLNLGDLPKRYKIRYTNGGITIFDTVQSNELSVDGNYIAFDKEGHAQHFAHALNLGYWISLELDKLPK